MSGVFNFLGFLVRHWLLSVLIVLSILSQALGYWQQGAAIWDAGPPAWVFQIIGYVLFVGVVTCLLYEWEKKIEALPAGPVKPKLSANDEAERRKAAERTAVLSQIAAAISETDWQEYTPPPESVDSGLATLGSVFTTLQKTYDVKTPTLDGHPDPLREGVRFLRRVEPFLKAGHDQEARDAAQDFLVPF